MIKNYLKIAWRNLIKNKAFTISNVVGLSLAFGVAILLGLAAKSELSHDRFHENLSDLYELYSLEQDPDGREVSNTFSVPCAPALKDEVPGIEHITRMTFSTALAKYEESELGISVEWVDEDFFSMFSFPDVHGQNVNPFTDKNSIAITRPTAEKIFGRSNVEGESLLLSSSGKEKIYTISTVLQDIKPESSISFEAAVIIENFPFYDELKEDWDNQNQQVFVQLKNGVDAETFEKSSREFSALHYANEIEFLKENGALPDENGQYVQLKLNPMKNKYLTKYINGEALVQTAAPYSIIVMVILILFIACVNYINMSIATGVKRLKEIGMRKTLGALKRQLFFQFWSESLIVFVGSIGIGLLLAYLFLEPFNTLARENLKLTSLILPSTLLISLGMVLVITFLAGGYPALLLSKLGTIQALKGKLEAVKKNRARGILIISQFAIAIFLISGTLVFRNQLDFMRNKDLGFNKDQVIAFPVYKTKDPSKSLELLRGELANESNILSISASSNILGRGEDGTSYTSQVGFGYKDKAVSTHLLVVDHDYIETVDLEVIEGRGFDRTLASDSTGVVINESMAASLGEENPIDAEFVFDGIKYPVIGIVKDYNFQGLDKEIEPISLFVNEGWGGIEFAYVKVAPENIQRSYQIIENTWKKLEPNAPFLGSFLDENVERLFAKEKITTTFITYGAIIAIIISCIGLFAVSLIVVTQRTKEIGVRKVVGATAPSITFMLTADFLRLVLISFLIATPFSWLMLSKWLEGYAYHITLSPSFYIQTGLLTAFIALLTISSRTIMASLENPINSLRSE